MHDFKLTGRTVAILVAGLSVAAAAGTLLDSDYAGLAVMLAVCAYLAKRDRRR